MDMKITAYSKEGFERIENALKLFNEDFIKKFESASENQFNNKIELSAYWNYEEIIYLNVDKICKVCVKTETTYEKSKDENENTFNTNEKYNLYIHCEKSNQSFTLIFHNRFSPDVELCFS